HNQARTDSPSSATQASQRGRESSMAIVANAAEACSIASSAPGGSFDTAATTSDAMGKRMMIHDATTSRTEETMGRIGRCQITAPSTTPIDDWAARKASTGAGV